MSADAQCFSGVSSSLSESPPLTGFPHFLFDIRYLKHQFHHKHTLAAQVALRQQTLLRGVWSNVQRCTTARMPARSVIKDTRRRRGPVGPRRHGKGKWSRQPRPSPTDSTFHRLYIRRAALRRSFSPKLPGSAPTTYDPRCNGFSQQEAGLRVHPAQVRQGQGLPSSPLSQLAAHARHQMVRFCPTTHDTHPASGFAIQGQQPSLTFRARITSGIVSSPAGEPFSRPLAKMDGGIPIIKHVSARSRDEEYYKATRFDLPRTPIRRSIGVSCGTRCERSGLCQPHRWQNTDAAFSTPELNQKLAADF